MRNILVVINPKAGKQRSVPVAELIGKLFQPNCPVEFMVWEQVERFDVIAERIRNGNFTDVIAAGGDGTVNRVGQELVNTSIRFGIVPLGSGNGLARSLDLSMNLQDCLKQLEQARTAAIDAGTVNGKWFFCTAGVGFDAHIGTLFANSVKRGLKSYVQIITREIFTYKAGDYEIRCNGQILKRKAFLITVANSGQYGNDFYIAPEASMTDGFFHVAIVKPFNPFKVVGLMWKILSRKAHLAKSIETIKADEIQLIRRDAAPVHLDGEPMIAPAEITFTIHKARLNVIVGKSFKVD